MKFFNWSKKLSHSIFLCFMLCILCCISHTLIFCTVTPTVKFVKIWVPCKSTRIVALWSFEVNLIRNYCQLFYIMRLVVFQISWKQVLWYLSLLTCHKLHVVCLFERKQTVPSQFYNLKFHTFTNICGVKFTIYYQNGPKSFLNFGAVQTIKLTGDMYTDDGYHESCSLAMSFWDF